MIVGTISLIIHIEGLLTIVAFAAEFSLGYPGHVDLVCPSCHLEDMVMTSAAIQHLS